MAGRVSVGLVALVVLIVVSGCGGGGGQSTASRTQVQARRTHRDASNPLKCHNGSSEARIPAKIIPGAEVDRYFPTITLWPLRSQWETGDCLDYAVVDAGAD